MPQKLIIDADPGIGDALAIALAIADPDLDVLALTAVGGCVSAMQAGRNLQAIVEALDPAKWPRIGVGYSGQRFQDEDEQHTIPDWQLLHRNLHGVNGLGEWRPTAADLHHTKDAVKLMTELSRQYPNEIVLLSMGPLTNLELACELDTEFLSRLKGVVCLAGAVSPPGDVTPVAEFNVHYDPTAARVVLRYPATKTLVPLDASQRTILTFEQYDRLGLTEETPHGRLLHQLIPFALRAHHQHLGMEGMLLAEVTALVAVARPQQFQRTTMAVDVEIEGELTRGMTVFDRRANPTWRKNIDVLSDVEPQGVLDYLTGILGTR
ncbi:MAG: nucleoside hydrolase [Planctomycetes bacterium]|nr:nucleoside hydrolase [Planctomycetota bacterium]